MCGLTSSHFLGLQKSLFLQGFTRDSWKPSGFRSKCHRLLGAVPLVALPTMKKQGFARLSHGSSYRSHAGPGVPANANRTSMGTNIAEKHMIPTFSSVLGNHMSSGLVATGSWRGHCRISTFFHCFLHFPIVHIPAVASRPGPWP